MQLLVQGQRDAKMLLGSSESLIGAIGHTRPAELVCLPGVETLRRNYIDPSLLYRGERGLERGCYGRSDFTLYRKDVGCGEFPVRSPINLGDDRRALIRYGNKGKFRKE